MSSFRKRNLPTSSWNLLPQLFMHVSRTWKGSSEVAPIFARAQRKGMTLEGTRS
ncbi:rCG60219 [Rattus norvegicus]|uniref:RCG60219 n=1 Tax=Rattus norvegicus TaxID=10116 RepID=A6HSM9_RAT|nr:rCG60219 [Rattus norvegicus]